MHSHPRAQKLAAPINETPLPPRPAHLNRKARPLPHSSPEVPQPTAWHFSSVRTCRVSYPLVIIGEGSISHHLGVVTSISPASFPAEFAEISQGILPWIPLPGTASSDLASSDLTSPSSGRNGCFIAPMAHSFFLAATSWFFYQAPRRIHLRFPMVSRRHQGDGARPVIALTQHDGTLAH